MRTQTLTRTPFGHRPDLAVLMLRVFFAAILMYGTQDNILSQEQMLEFRDFLERNGFPWPLLSAHVSVYAQFLAGALILIGLATRWAALVMVVNFIIALLMVHLRLPFSANIAPLSMLALATFFVVHGPGRWSLDEGITASRTAPPQYGDRT